MVFFSPIYRIFYDFEDLITKIYTQFHGFFFRVKSGLVSLLFFSRIILHFYFEHFIKTIWVIMLSTTFSLVQNRIHNVLFSSGKRHLHRATKSFSARKKTPLFRKILRRWYPVALSMRISRFTGDQCTFYDRSMRGLKIYP